jgi:hypothetical protein
MSKFLQSYMELKVLTRNLADSVFFFFFPLVFTHKIEPKIKPIAIPYPLLQGAT